MQHDGTGAPWMSRDGVEGLVSTIIPAFNRAELITDALDSLLGQDYRPLEIIVVDDGSTDGTADVAERWALRHADSTLEVKVIRQVNAGVSAARNRGMIESRGEYIQFLDSDDLLMPNKVSTQVKGLRGCDKLYCCGLSSIMKGRGVPRVSTTTLCISETNKPFYASYAWSVNAVLYRRSLLQCVGTWDESVAIAEDALFALKVKLIGGRPLVIPVVSDVYRDIASARAMRIDSMERLRWYCAQAEVATMKMCRLLVDWRVDTTAERSCLVRGLLQNAARASRLPSKAPALSSLQCAATVARSPFDRIRVIAMRALVHCHLLWPCSVVANAIVRPCASPLRTAVHWYRWRRFRYLCSSHIA